jgi:hypothetical protein
VRNFLFPRLTIFVAASTLFYSVIGCGGASQSTKHLDRYDALPYRDSFVVKAEPADVHKAALLSLQQQGFVITLSDPISGLVTAEKNGADRIAAELKQEASGKEDSRGTLETILGAVGILFLLGVLAAIFSSGCNQSSSSSAQSGSTTYVNRAPETKKSYRYVVTVNTETRDTLGTVIQFSAVRMYLENGSIQSTEPFSNKYLNYELFDGIAAKLGRE